MCWQSAGCDGIGPTQTSPAFYWLQLHMRRCDILTEFRVCCSSVRMKQLQFLFSNNRGPEVFWGIMTLIIICHQNDNDHHHHWDETLWTVPVASESIRFYMSTYSAHYTLLYIVYIYILPVLCVPLIDFITLHKVKCSSCIHSQMAVSLSQLGCLTIQRWAKKGHKFYVQSLKYIEKIQADFLDFHMGPTNLQIKISLGRNKIVFLALVELPLPLYCY